MAGVLKRRRRLRPVCKVYTTVSRALYNNTAPFFLCVQLVISGQLGPNSRLEIGAQDGKLLFLIHAPQGATGAAAAADTDSANTDLADPPATNKKAAAGGSSSGHSKNAQAE